MHFTELCPNSINSNSLFSYSTALPIHPVSLLCAGQNDPRPPPTTAFLLPRSLGNLTSRILVLILRSLTGYVYVKRIQTGIPGHLRPADQCKILSGGHEMQIATL